MQTRMSKIWSAKIKSYHFFANHTFSGLFFSQCLLSSHIFFSACHHVLILQDIGGLRLIIYNYALIKVH